MSEQSAKKEEEGLREALRKLFSPGEGEAQQPQQGVITGVDITKLLEYVLNDKPRPAVEEKSLATVREILQVMETESRSLVDVFVNDGLSRVVHPLYGDTLILTRLGEVAVLLRQIIRREWALARKLLREGAPPEEVLAQLRRAEYLTKLSYLIIVSVADKLMTLLFLNAPARARPPLANAALGFELVK